MESIKLNIIHIKNRYGALIPFTHMGPYIIYFNDIEIAKIPNGRRVSLDVPANKRFLLTISMIGLNSLMQKMTPHSALSYKKVTIYPEYCKNGIVNCTIKTHINLIGTSSFGLLNPMWDLDVSIDYN